jgi:hypothetical protein
MFLDQQDQNIADFVMVALKDMITIAYGLFFEKLMILGSINVLDRKIINSFYYF